MASAPCRAAAAARRQLRRGAGSSGLSRVCTRTCTPPVHRKARCEQARSCPHHFSLYLSAQGRGYHTSAWAGQGQDQEAEGEEGVDPSIKYQPSEGLGVS